MVDPLSLVAKHAVGAIELASDGALRSLREQLLPDVDTMLRAQAEKAHEEMWLAVIVVARVLIAKAHGTDVTEFLNRAASDPAFAARSVRLLSQSLRTPNEARRRILALALFAPHHDPDTRDRVDGAIERLEPADVELLRLLSKHDAARRGYKLLREPANTIWSFGRVKAIDAILANQSPGAPAIPCSVLSLFSLQNTGCVEIGEPGGLADSNDLGLVVRELAVLSLGRAVLEVLYTERAGVEFEEAASRGL